jgi:hypothetical protein
MTAQKLISALEQSPMQRLRWLVCRTFGVLPCSRQAKRMTDVQCLRIAALLAAEKYGSEEAESTNSAFDGQRFMELKGVRDG